MALRLPPVFGGSLARGLRTLSGMSEAELVPKARLAGPMPWVIAIMVALTVVATAAGLALSNIAGNAADELSGGVTIQIVEANPTTRLQQAEAAVARLNRTPRVEAATIVSEDEVERLIEPWLSGLSGVQQDIPVPALIDVRMRDPVTGETLGALRRLVREVAPAARVDAQSTWLGPVFATIDSLRLLSFALVGMLAAALAASVLLAVRNALGANRDTIEIVHLLGGTDHQIARVFQRSVGFDAAGGGTIGLGLGLIAVLLLGRQFAGLGAGLVSGGALGWIDWVLLALVPLAGVALAMITARLTVLRALREML
ncbi:cell division protein [Novosphingobium sp.]|uniref:cell division protein FtsX n=1 Tax=Novosphingobium sp. TaxID=1874826 RepID=UPI0022C4DC08|nr:cell division protein [Novosphingobium sp.]MCZ8020020.1 cell division protein [Novosphingobium sp.]MCZ8035665.1 cell division protein [Novosphingobium sp.]MCZ8053063.1 cell division protein [Novosphingobium sp.]MCZ8061060.1 cell division protein [Novosphingobium sp.]MCZ8230789.1 cell division protein [Novosphingobium sp.]